MSKDRTVNIELGDKEWEGVYSNFVIVSHSNAEFIIDFARMLPGAKKAKVFKSRNDIDMGALVADVLYIVLERYREVKKTNIRR